MMGVGVGSWDPDGYREGVGKEKSTISKKIKSPVTIIVAGLSFYIGST